MRPGRISWAGVAYALGAFGLWGLFPLYFKAVAAIPPPEVLSHRILWSVLFVALLLVLGEALTRLQWIAVVLAAAGVGWMLAGVGRLPWVALVLAATFGSYGLLRKTTAVGAAPGLFVETLLLAPPALAFLLWLGPDGVFARVSLADDLLLAAAGLVTAIPLILFAQAARRLRLASVGLFQYITPTGHLLLAVGVFGEAFTADHAITFGCIWLALALYSFSAWRTPRRATVLRDV